MTSTLNPRPRPGAPPGRGPTSLADRRRAALERLHGGPLPERRPRWERAGGRSAGADPDGFRGPPIVGPPAAPYYAIAAVVGVFVLLGLVMVLSASAVTQANVGNSPYDVFARQAAWAAVGLVALVVVSRIPYRFWRRFSVPLLVVGLLAMLTPFAPSVGTTVNGARSWARFGSFSAQPSELLKLVLVVVAADLLVRRRHELWDRRRTMLPLAVIAAIAAGLSLAQGDLGSAVVIGAILLAIAWIGGVPLFEMVTMASVAIVATGLFVMSSPRRLDRFTAFLDVTGEKDHLAYQTYQGFLSIASGGLTGTGIGGSNGKLGYLPYAHTDFIFAVIAEELGLIGAGAVILGFVLLVFFGIQTALAAPDRFGMLLAGGLAAWFGVQTIVNLGGVTGLMPVTGLTLPFFSAGGSSLFVSMVAAGLLLSVARRIGRPGAAAADREDGG